MPVQQTLLLRLLRQRPAFRRLLLADLVTQVGEGTLFIALPMLILEATGDVTVTGLAFSGEIVAYGLLSPVAGTLADRLDQKSLMIGANLLRTLILLGLLAVLAGHGGLAPCMALSAALGAAGAFFLPARAAFLRRLLEGEELDCAIAADGTMGFLIRLVSPAVVGVLLTRFPASCAIWLDVGTYLAGALLLAPRWVQGRHLEGPPELPAGAWREGWRHVLSSPALSRLLLLDVLLSTVGTAAWATTVALLVEVLHRSAADNGWLMAATGLAGALGTRLSGVVPRNRALYPALAGLFAASYLVVPAAGSLAGLLGIWCLRGAALGLFVVVLNQQIACETPAEVMGRVQAAWGLAVCLAAFAGSLSTPVLLRTLGAGGAFHVFGGAMALVGLWLALDRGTAEAPQAEPAA